MREGWGLGTNQIPILFFQFGGVWLRGCFPVISEVGASGDGAGDVAQFLEIEDLAGELVSEELVKGCHGEFTAFHLELSTEGCAEDDAAWCHVGRLLACLKFGTVVRPGTGETKAVLCQNQGELHTVDAIWQCCDAFVLDGCKGGVACFQCVAGEIGTLNGEATVGHFFVSVETLDVDFNHTVVCFLRGLIFYDLGR